MEPRKPDEFKMHPHEFQEMRDMIDKVKQSDHQLGNVLHIMANHLGHLHGYDYAHEDAKKRLEG